MKDLTDEEMDAMTDEEFDQWIGPAGSALANALVDAWEKEGPFIEEESE